MNTWMKRERINEWMNQNWKKNEEMNLIIQSMRISMNEQMNEWISDCMNRIRMNDQKKVLNKWENEFVKEWMTE